MNFLEFTKKWIARIGVADKDSDYEGMIGEAVQELAETFSKQGHSGSSATVVSELFYKLHKDYSDPKSPVWQDYWNSPEGKELQRIHGVDMTKK